MGKLRRWFWLFSCLIGGLSACQSEADLSTPTGIVAATAIPPTSSIRIDLPNDLRPRGVSDDWYVASAMDGSTLYLMDIESSPRTVISEHGGWGAVVVTQTTVSWIDDNGHVQQHNIVSGETSQLTQVSAERSNLVGNDRWLVWQDKRNEMGDANYYAADIYAYDLSSGEEVTVAVADGVQQQPALYNDLIVWADNRNSPVRGEPLEGCSNCPDNPFDIYSFNLQTRETAVLAADEKHNAQPTISYNHAAWITFGEGINVMDLGTGVVERAVLYEQGMAQPWLFGNQLRYVVKQDCDVILVDETGQEIPGNTGAFLFDLASRETMQLTSYKEPLVLHSLANVLIAEGCMTGFEAVYLLRNLHLPSAESTVRGPAVISYDPDLQVTDWAYLDPDSAFEFPLASESVRVLDELHYEIRLRQTTTGFDLIWGNFPCSTQPVLFIQPDNRLEFWPGNIVDDDCVAMEAGHIISVSLNKNVPLADWWFIFHDLPGDLVEQLEPKPDGEAAVPIDPAAIQIGAPILFARDNDLWRASINGQNAQRLTEGELLADWFARTINGDPWWWGGFPPQVHVSPDGRWLAFTQNGHNLILVDVTGTEATRISPLSGMATVFAWSPDSRQFVFGRNTLKLYDVATNSITNLLSGYGQGVHNPVWSLDGRFLAFACCFEQPGPGPYDGVLTGEIRQIELASGQVETVGETWNSVGGGTPSMCWAVDGTVGIDVPEPITCSFDPQAMGHLPGDSRYAYFFIQSPDEDELFHWLGVKDRASDIILWEREVPFTQRVHWSPDGQWLFLGNDYYYIEQAAIYRLPADGSGEAEILLPDALLLDVIAAWQ